jgi:hypothetical protein
MKPTESCFDKEEEEKEGLRKSRGVGWDQKYIM